jgi:hypothetical protein
LFAGKLLNMEYSHLFLEVENKIQNASNLGIQANG